MNFFTQLLIICPLIFLAGFIDSIAGGGGLISGPAFLLAGLPVHATAATNKVSATFGTTLSAINYSKKGKIKWETAIISSICSFIGSFIGSRILLMISDQELLKKAFVFILPFIAVFVMFGKKSGDGEQKIFGKKLYIVAGIIGVLIGAYDGLIGPGTGTFLIFAYTTFVGYDYITASGNAKIINLASNVAAALSFVLAGKVEWLFVIPAAASNMLGNYLGSSYALKHGSGAVKKMLVVVMCAIFVSLLIEVL